MTRPYLTTSDCARVLGVSTRYVRDEIRDGRLQAEVVNRPPAPRRTKGYAAIRVYPHAFTSYLQTYWPRISAMFHAEQENVNDAKNANA